MELNEQLASLAGRIDRRLQMLRRKDVEDAARTAAAAIAKIGATVEDAGNVKVDFDQTIAEEPTPASDEERTTPPVSGLEESVRKFRLAAALSGSFDPSTYFRSDKESLCRAVLARTLPDFTVDHTPAGDRWRMKPGPRAALLMAEFAVAPLTGRKFRGLPKAQDDYGRLLRRVMQQGAEFKIKGLSQDSLRLLRQIIDDLACTPLPLPAAADVNRLLDARAFADEFLPTVTPFVGRVAELRRLRKYVESPGDTSGGWRGLLVTGLGGSGKTALLTHFLGQLFRARSATLVILDFDRPGIDPGDTVWLRLEIARQVGLQYPDAAEALRQARQRTRAEQTGRQAMGYDRDSQIHGSDDLLALVRIAIESYGGRDKPLLLVLDTIETIAAHPARDRLPGFIDLLADIFSPQLRVLVCGRVFGDAFAKFTHRCEPKALRLDELQAAAARSLLKKLGVGDAMAKKLVALKQLPLRPLALKLLAREACDGRLTPADLANDLQSAGRELAEGILYRRTLLRLPEGLVRDLACPGLVLRFVTVELILEVLVPAIRSTLSEEQAAEWHVTPGEAKDAYDKLAAEAWLVVPDEQGRLRHRPDIRRDMLSLMKIREPKQTRAVSREAERHFHDAGDAPEALYHKLLWADGSLDDATANEVKAFHSALVLWVDDLPPAASSLVRLKAGVDLSVTEFMALPPSEFLENCFDFLLARIYNRGYTDAVQVVNSLNSKQIEMELTIGKSQRYSLSLSDTSDKYYLVFKVWFAVAEWDSAAATQSIRSKFQELYYFLMMAKSPAITNRHEWGDAFRNPNYLVRGAPTWTLERSAFIFAAIIDEVINGKSMVVDVFGAAWNLEPRSDLLLPHRFALLDHLCRRQVRTVVNPHLLALRRETIDHPFVLAHEKVAAGFRTLFAKLDADAKKGRLTTRLVLSAVGTLMKKPEFLEPAEVPPGIDPMPLFRGPDVEYRDPVRYALLEAFTDAAGYEQLAMAFQAQLDLPLKDLAPVAFAEAMAVDAEHVLMNPIELVDRAWRLGDFLAAAVRLRPDAAKLVMVKESHDHWALAAQTAIETR